MAKPKKGTVPPALRAHLFTKKSAGASKKSSQPSAKPLMKKAMPNCKP